MIHRFDEARADQSVQHLLLCQVAIGTVTTNLHHLLLELFEKQHLVVRADNERILRRLASFSLHFFKGDLSSDAIVV